MDEQGIKGPLGWLTDRPGRGPLSPLQGRRRLCFFDHLSNSGPACRVSDLSGCRQTAIPSQMRNRDTVAIAGYCGAAAGLSCAQRQDVKIDVVRERERREEPRGRWVTIECRERGRGG